MKAFSAWPKKMPTAGSSARTILMREYSIHFSRLLSTRRSPAGRTSSPWPSKAIGCPGRSSAYPPRATTTLMTLPPCRQASRPSGVQTVPGQRYADLGRHHETFWSLDTKSVNTLSINIHIHVTFITP